MQITIEQAKTEIDSVLQKVRRGEEVVIYEQDKPFAKVTPIQDSKGGRRFGSGSDLISFVSDDFDETPEGFNEYL
jgi:antitoxin (DNA-binding transcriptional repressor) of toxin-antitoxin stability system